ncbi:MAG: hypothetical protein JW839_09570 [Candidatus Lokiarchaeota archaeon]|nr:hypothetical protein [Candidatus Lokiarchaeota archaeon]
MDERQRARLPTTEAALVPAKFVESLRTIGSLERRVLSVAKGVIEKHRALNVQDLFEESRRALRNEGHEQIWNAIDSLVRKRIIYPRRAFTRETVLDNENRRRVFELISRRPGIHVSQIRSALGLDYRTAALHIEMLETFRLIRTEHIENNVVYFEHGTNAELDWFYYYLNKKNVLAIVGAILDSPGTSFKQLQEKLEGFLDRTTLLRKLHVLAEKGFFSVMYDANAIVSIDVQPRLVDKARAFAAAFEGSRP